MKHDSICVTTVFSCAVLLALLSLTGLVAAAQTGEDIAAIVNGRKITRAAVDALVPSQYQNSEPKRLHALRLAALENVIIRALLEEEAGRRKISVEALRKQMTLGAVEITTKQVEREYLENAPFFGSMSPDEAKERLRLVLENDARMKLYRAGVEKLKKKAVIEILLREPESAVVNIVNRVHPAKGAANPAVTIIEFSDFRCSFCRDSREILAQVMSVYQEKVRLIYKHLPLQTTPQALAPAIAARCAEKQGRFWEFHDRLFAAESFSPASLKRLAGETGLETEEFSSCIISADARSAVLSDLEEAAKAGISATPTFVINGRIYTGKLSFAEFKNIIEGELAPPH